MEEKIVAAESENYQHDNSKMIIQKKILRTSIYTYGITIAPRSEIASLVAPVPLS